MPFTQASRQIFWSKKGSNPESDMRQNCLCQICQRACNHLPSAVTTTIVIIIVLIATWTLLRLYNRFAKARQPTDQTRPGQPPATSPPTTLAPAWPVPPTPWPSPPTAPTRTSTSLTLDMDTLMKALRSDPTPPVQASGPPPNLAHLP